MSECDNPTRRNGDKSRMAALANSAAWNLASRLAVFVVLGLIAFTANRSLSVLDRMDDDVRVMAKSLAVITNEIAEHSRRIEKVENKVFR